MGEGWDVPTDIVTASAPCSARVSSPRAAPRRSAAASPGSAGTRGVVLPEEVAVASSGTREIPARCVRSLHPYPLGGFARGATPVMAPLEEAEPTGSVRPAAPDSPRHSALAPDSATCPLDSALPPLLAVPVRVVDVAGDAAGRQHGHLILHAGHGSTAQLAGGGAPLLASAPPHTRARLPGCSRCREGAGRAPAGAERGCTGSGLARRSGRVSGWP